MARLDVVESFETLKDRVKESITNNFPQEGDKNILEINNVEIKDEISSDDVTAQKQSKMNGRTWGVPVHATMVLKDKKSGKILDERRQKIATLPKITHRFSWIVDGSEFQVDNQWRLKPGVYTKIKQNGELQSFFNIKGTPMHVDFDPKTRVFKARREGSNPPLYPIMKAMGISDDVLEKKWGKDILAANKVDGRGRPLDVDKVAVAFANKMAPPGTEVKDMISASQIIKDTFAESGLDPKVTKRTLGKPISKIDPDALLRSSGRLLGIARGEEKPDVRDSLMYKDFMSAEDFISERIDGNSNIISRRIKNNLDRRTKIRDVVGPDIFQRPIKEFFSKVSLASTPEQTNPLKMISGQMRTTIAGEGGVKDANRITEDAKLVDPSHFGILDPLHTPECFDDKTEVFTDRGWLYWKDVLDDDLLACNIDGRLEFHPPERVIRSKYSGTMYGAKHSFLEYLVTPNHRMWVRPLDKRTIKGGRWRFESSEFIYGKTRNVTTVHKPYCGNEVLYVDIVGHKIEAWVWSSFVGWYLSEGSYTSHSVRIHQSKSANPENCDEIENLLCRMPFEWNEDDTSYRVNDKDLAEYFSKFGTQEKRWIPEELLDFDEHCREHLLVALLKGDGRLNYRRTNGNTIHDRDTFTTTSSKLAADTEKLIIGLGYAAISHSYQDKREERYLDVYEVRIQRRKERVIRGEKDQYKVEYDGMVYCATVPGGLLYTRRNGKCPFWSGNSDKTGVNLQLSLGARKDKHGVKLPLINAKTGKTEYVSSEVVHDSVVALPDSVKKVGKKFVPKGGSTVKASAANNEIRDVKMKDVQYVVPKSSQMFSIATNMVPFISSDSPNRATMAGRHMEQAIPIVNNEAPLVQSMLGKKSFDELVGQFASHNSPVNGKVLRVEKDAVIVQGDGNKKHKIPIYNNYPLNDKKGFIDSKVKVKAGDTVKKGQLLADTNYTKEGVYAPGTNLNVAYMPWKGYNFEDGVVISESAARKMTSEHMYKKGLSTRDAQLSGKKKYQAYYPDRVNKEQMEKLDDEGVVQVGQKVKPGDTLIAALAERKLTTEEQKMKMLHKSLVKPYKDKAMTWEEDYEGEVVEVVKRGKKVDVHVKTKEPMQVGDKLVGRHGNKGITTNIIPDEEMPKTKDGKPIEVLMNPIGTPGRMNVGQVCETAAGKIAEKRGQPFKIANFEVDDNLTYVENELKKEGIKDKEDLVDPATGKEIKGVQVGKQYILKLEHQVGKKMASRDRDSYDRNLVPKGGGPHGAQALGSLGMYAMLAHGAKANIREMQTYKCFTWSTKVITDHGMIEIGKIVNQRMNVKVLSFNMDSGLEFRSILNYWKRGMDDTPLVELTVHSQSESGVFKCRRIRCTHKHEIYDSDLVKTYAKDIDTAVISAHSLTDEQREIMIGSLLGDGSLGVHNGKYPAFKERHSIKQKEYLEFKACVFSDLSKRSVKDYNAGTEGFNNGQLMCEWSTLAQPVFSEFMHMFYHSGKKAVPHNIADLLTPLALSVWYQDDGSLTHGDRQRILRIHTGSFDDNDRDLLIKAIENKYGLKFNEAVNNGSVDLRLEDKKSINKFIDLVKPYIHPSLSYKVGGAECGYALEDVLSNCTSGFDVFASKVESVRNVKPLLWEGQYLYNLEVEGNHNYFAGGILVGNSDKAQGGDNDELWGAIQAGEMLPPPKTTFAYKKFNAYLKGMGVNTEKDGNSLNLVPLTDKQVLEMSNGELKDPGRVIKMRTLQPEKGGLLDPKITGGHDGTNWSHIKLKKPMPNPLFEKAIMSVTGVRGPQYDRLINGEDGVTPEGTIVSEPGVKGAVYGPDAVGRLLEKVDVKSKLKDEEARIPKLKGQLQNESRRKIKFLRALDKLDMKPTDAYMMKNVPVLPPNMRPIAALEDGSIQTDDLNEIYKNLGIVNKKLGEFPKGTPEAVKSPIAADVYDHLKALTGLGGNLNRKHPGLINVIAGRGGPKTGYAQDVLIKRKMDMTARSTIVPEPSLSLDEAEIPKKAAKEMYKAFIVRDLRRTAGVSPLQAKKMIEEDDPLAKKALERVTKERPILLKRDPVLHKYGIQAFKPRLVDGKAIKIHPLVCSGYNADFDGDTMSAYVPITQDAVKEAREMFPSRNLFSPATSKVMYQPSHEAQVGLFMMAEVDKKTKLSFKDHDELKKAVRDGKLGFNDIATVGGMRTTLGRMKLNSILPKQLQGGKLLTDPKYRFTKGEQAKMFNQMAKTDKRGYPSIINKMKDMGNNAVTVGGFSFGIEDFKVHKDVRDPILNSASKKASKLDLNKKEDVDKFIDIYEDAMNKIDSKLKDRINDPKQKSHLAKLEISAGIKGRGYRQLTAAPVMFVDGKGEVVTSPVKKSYSEGLDTASYWAATSGGRKGAIQKVQSVSEPGYMTKLMMNSTMDHLVAADDCKTGRGVSLSLDEPDVIGRYTTADIKLQKGSIPSGTILTPDLISRMKNSKVTKVVVRSPMRCNHGKGVCARCMGLNEDGQLSDKGTNVGVLAAQSLGERGTQLAMKAFHCFANDSTALVRILDDDPSLVTMERLFKRFASLSSVVGGEEVISLPSGTVHVWDSESWVEVTAIRRHAPTSPLVAVRSEDKIIITQDNHETAIRGADGRVEFAAPNSMSANTELFCDLSWCSNYGSEENDLDLNPYMVGMYVAEGWIGYRWTNKSNKVKKPYSIGMKQNKGPIRDKLLSVIPKEWNPRQSGDTIEIHRLSLGTRFEKLFSRYSRNVSLPPDFIHYSDEWLYGFLCGLVDGDGIITGDYATTYACIDTTSFELVQQLSVISRRLGIKATAVVTTVRPASENQVFRVTLWLTKSIQNLMRESVKVSSAKVLADNYDLSEDVGFTPLGQVKPVLYDREFVYDLTTTSSQLVVGGLLSHNSGGVYEGRKASEQAIEAGGLDRATNILTLKKKVKGSATLAQASGKITAMKKDPAGGFNVMIGGTRSYVPANRVMKRGVKVGAAVKRGDPLTRGPINPHDMLPLTGMSKVQGHMAGELHSIYGQYGIRRRHSELMVRALSNVTKVEDKGDHPDLLPGDFATTSQVYEWNKKSKGLKPVKHKPVLRGVKQVPLDVQTDWMARLNHEHLKDTIVDAAQQGWQSNLHGQHPIPPLIHGAEFGRGTKDAPWAY